MHQPFAGASLRITMFQVPTSCLVGGFSCSSLIVLVTGSGSRVAGCVGVFLAFGSETVFLMTHGEGWPATMSEVGRTY